MTTFYSTFLSICSSTVFVFLLKQNLCPVSYYTDYGETLFIPFL